MPYAEVGDNVDFNVTGQLVIMYFAFIIHLRKNENKRRPCISYIQTGKKVYDPVRREVLYNILIEFGISMNLVSLIKMCLNATYSRVWVCKYLSGIFPIQNCLKQRVALSLLLSSLALEYTISRVQEARRALNCWVHISFLLMLMVLIYWVKASTL